MTLMHNSLGKTSVLVDAVSASNSNYSAAELMTLCITSPECIDAKRLLRDVSMLARMQ